MGSHILYPLISFPKSKIGVMNKFSLRACGATCGVGHYTQQTYRKLYGVWFNMIERCYDEKFQSRHKSYIGCSVCSEWLNFQSFARWYESQNAPMGWHIDKDIRFKGNKVYSPETCGLVPPEVNKMFVCQKHTKHDLPLGVFYKPRYTKSGKFTHYDIFASCKNAEGKQIHLGYFKSVDEAAIAYKQFKMGVISSLAEKYCNELTDVMYNALINYQL